MPYICIDLPSKALVIAFVGESNTAVIHPLGSLKELPVVYMAYQQTLQNIPELEEVRDRLSGEWIMAVKERNRLLLGGF